MQSRYKTSCKRLFVKVQAQASPLTWIDRCKSSLYLVLVGTIRTRYDAKAFACTFCRWDCLSLSTMLLQRRLRTLENFQFFALTYRSISAFPIDNNIITRIQERQKIHIFCANRGTKNGRKSLEITGFIWVVFLDTDCKINTPNTHTYPPHTPKPNQIPHQLNNTPTFSTLFLHFIHILIQNRTISSKLYPLHHLTKSHPIYYLSTHHTNISPNFSFAKPSISRSHIQLPHIQHSNTNLTNESLLKAITGGTFKLYRSTHIPF